MGSSCVFVLGIALPPLLATREEVARLTGATLSLSYTTAFLGPLVGGAL
jgi:CP family cyanate transporter-like MFS transporter